jgi:hypothetical protein
LCESQTLSLLARTKRSPAPSLFRRLQAGAVRPFVDIFCHFLMARPRRRLGVIGLARQFVFFVHWRLLPANLSREPDCAMNNELILFRFYSLGRMRAPCGTNADWAELVRYSINPVRGLAMTDPRGERLQIMLSPDELVVIDDFRFKHRMPTRAAAVRELMRLGLTVDAVDGDGQKSSQYGVVSRGPTDGQDNNARG